jgi:hypothetical protein
MLRVVPWFARHSEPHVTPGCGPPRADVIAPLIRYNTMPTDGSGSWSTESVGFEDQTGTKGVQISYGEVPRGGTAYYIPPACHVAGGEDARSCTVSLHSKRTNLMGETWKLPLVSSASNRQPKVWRGRARRARWMWRPSCHLSVIWTRQQTMILRARTVAQRST